MKSGLNLETGNWFDDLPKLNLPRVVPSGQQIEKSLLITVGLGLKVGVKLVSGATDSNAAFTHQEQGNQGSGPPLLAQLLP